MKTKEQKRTVTTSVAEAGGTCDTHTLKQLGWTQRQIEAAVKRGELRWLRDGRVELTE